MAWKLRALVDICVLALLVVLDARDVWYKVRWLGPDDRFLFPAEFTAVLSDSVAHSPASTGSMSAWSSFLDKCESLQAFSGGYFQQALATNCVIGGELNTTGELIPSLVLTSDVRVDAMAWAACRLLHTYRRPPVCHDDLVTEFLRRYNLPAPRIGADAVAEPMSSAEVEVLELLETVSKSMPLSNAVCVSGFELPTAGDSGRSVSNSSPQIFGCASPSVHLGAFVGHFTAAFSALQADKTWLTTDDVDFLGMHFSVRQNARTSYTVRGRQDNSDRSSLVVETHAAISLSISGMLYIGMVAMDVALMIVHAWSSLELCRLLVTSPHWSTAAEPDTVGARLNRISFFGCPLIRSTPVVLLTVCASTLSWLLILPNSVVLDVASSAAGKFHASLTLVRVWPLALIALHGVWGLFVLMDERRAYYLAKKVFIPSWEIAGIVASVCYLSRRRFLSVRPEKLQLEKQRLVDAEAFADLQALSNSFSIDGGISTSLCQLYSPLLFILCLSVALFGAVLAVRGVFVAPAKRSSMVVCGTPATDDGGASDDGTTPILKRGSASSTTMSPYAGYTRLPLEELLDIPIRAKDLVRYGRGAPLERTVHSEQFLWTMQHLAHGVLLESERFLSSRRGFVRVLPVDLPADDRAAAEQQEEEGSGSPKRRHYFTPLR